MKTREISREQWVSFFEEFSRRHLVGLATVAVLEDRLGAQVEASGLPFPGVVLGKPGDHLEHPVRAPRRAWLEIDEDGAEAVLQIEASDGTKPMREYRAIAD